MRVIGALALLLLASTAQAAPSASFTARPVQGATCVAPCAVHFDAIGDGTTETTDPTFSREFHSLLFLWDFGDSVAGTWAYSGLPKNRDTGAIAGHLYTLPGTYTVRLKVVNPSGESSITSEAVTVADPDAEFTSAQTWCFRDAGDGGFTGCPLDTNADGTCDGADADHCITNADFDNALTDNTDTVGCNADFAAARCLFRRGDTFAQSASVTLASGASPGLIDAFGSGARPQITGASQFLSLGDRWTVAHLDPDRTGGQGFNVGHSIDNLTLYDITIDGHESGCFTVQTGTPPAFNQLIAGIEVQCERATTNATETSIFVFADYFLWLGGLDDINNATGPGEGPQFNFRSVHLRWGKLAHNRFREATNSRNTIQIRAWDEPSPAYTPSEWWIIADNVLSQRDMLYTIRVCQNSGCNDLESDAVENQNGIIERNFIFVDTTTSPQAPQGFWIAGGDITIRNNMVDFQGYTFDGTNDFFVTHAANYTGASNDDRVQVFNNTFFRDDVVNNAFVLCRDISSGHAGGYCRNNLVDDRGNAGAYSDSSGTWDAVSNNLDAASNPFAVDPPEQGLTTWNDFILASPNAATIDAGYDFAAGTDTDRWVYDDAFLGCRGGEWDIGADEVGVSSCFLGFPSVGSGLDGGASNQGGGF